MTGFSQTPALSVVAFRVWVWERRGRESLVTIAKSLGVSAPAVVDWISGRRRPSRTVRLLAAYLMHGPQDAVAGLPGDPPVRRPPGYRPRAPLCARCQHLLQPAPPAIPNPEAPRPRPPWQPPAIPCPVCRQPWRPPQPAHLRRHLVVRKGRRAEAATPFTPNPDLRRCLRQVGPAAGQFCQLVYGHQGKCSASPE
jgi:hypothetical protein